jgi:hypothetical protein
VLTSDGPRIIETHLRLASDLSPVVPAVTGVDLVELQIRQIMGERVLPEIRRTLAREPPGKARSGALWYANTDLRGQLVKLVGIDDLGPDAEVTVTPLLAPGAPLDGLASNYSRLAEAVAFAAEPAQALALARAAIAGLRVVVHAAPVETECF